MEKRKLLFNLLPHWPAVSVSMTISALGELNGSEREPMTLAGTITSEFLSKRASLLPSNTNMLNTRNSSLLLEALSTSPLLLVTRNFKPKITFFKGGRTLPSNAKMNLAKISDKTYQVLDWVPLVNESSGAGSIVA